MNKMLINYKILNKSDNYILIKVIIKLFLDGFWKYCRLFNMNLKKKQFEKKKKQVGLLCNLDLKIMCIYFVKLVLNIVVVCI